MRILFLLLASVPLMTTPITAAEQWAFIASPPDPQAIYRATLNPETGELGQLELAVEGIQTGFMALHPKLPILYAGCADRINGETQGVVRAYQFDSGIGELEQISQSETNDGSPTHIEVAPDGSSVAVCHYGGDGTTLIPLDDQGKLVETSLSQIKHQGSSVNEKRQTRPHPHGVAYHRDGNFLLVADLGNDHVEVFEITDDRQLRRKSYWQAAPGAGPRHVTFHSSLDVAYCINELDSTISVLQLNPKSGELSELQTVSTLPENFSGNNTTAEVVVHPSGKFVYGSNRGHESTAVFQVDTKTGKLSFVEREPTQGNHPRFVGLDRTGSVYLAANMQSNNIVSFRVNPDSGKLDPAGHTLEVQRPMCIVFAAKE
ncbi:lactonase family protein [Rubinisphaera margarita]|uniref:lactonase family protein n=1 Tax=Rubinisphaera margarita TaxID=2909586 RepID=UPI001EE80C7D|nr:lactonase family protein [Rubinisphaera margarita]MCG6158391.1 lactonase family protein [Rubinisphaera margarita]